MNDPIAESRFVLRWPDGTELSTAAQVALPVRIGEYEWTCQVEIPGADGPRTIYGVDSFQALLLATDFLAARLADLGDKGAAFLSSDRREPIAIADIVHRRPPHFT